MKINFDEHNCLTFRTEESLINVFLTRKDILDLFIQIWDETEYPEDLLKYLQDAGWKIL